MMAKGLSRLRGGSNFALGFYNIPFNNSAELKLNKVLFVLQSYMVSIDVQSTWL